MDRPLFNHKHITSVPGGGSLMVLITLLWLPHSLQGQEAGRSPFKEIKSDAEIRYGPPPELLNGEKYYYPYGSALGNPYLEAPDEGTLLIDGTVYRNQQLKYDIYNQLLVLDYKDLSHAPVSIVVGAQWLESFTLGNKLFKKFPDRDGQIRFGQVIHEGRYSCIYFWKKKYTPDLQNRNNQYEFSESMRSAVILYNHHHSPFTGKRSFIRAFPKTEREQIKQILKEQRIKIKKARDPEMRALMERINQIPGSDE